MEDLGTSSIDLLIRRHLGLPREAKKKETTIMAQNLDGLTDVVPNILLRLPVKSLRRFSCVNKSWYHLIKSPDFIFKHLHTFNNHMNLTDPINLLVNGIRLPTSDPFALNQKVFVYLLSYNPSTTNHSSLNLLDLFYNHNEVTHLEILGPCNGLYCLYTFSILVINPSIREVRILLDAPAPPETYCMQHFPGFGFDPKTNDYKVVRIMETWHHKRDEQLFWRVEIYSLSSDCWSNVDCPLPPVSISNGSWIDAFVHGAFHWWAYDAGGGLVLAFDMLSETFRSIRLPNVRSSSREYAGTVAMFRESLAVIVYPRRGTDKCFDLWVLEDYDNEGSWTKHSIIGPIVGAKRPLGFFEKRDLFLSEDNDGRMLFYDLHTKEIKQTGFHGEEGSLQATMYLESLVSPRRDKENSQNSQAGSSFFGGVGADDVITLHRWQRNADAWRRGSRNYHYVRQGMIWRRARGAVAPSPVTIQILVVKKGNRGICPLTWQ